MVISIGRSWYVYSGMCNDMCRGVITGEQAQEASGRPGRPEKTPCLMLCRNRYYTYTFLRNQYYYGSLWILSILIWYFWMVFGWYFSVFT